MATLVCLAPPGEARDLTGNALNLPAAICQGGADPVVRHEGVREIRDELLKAGVSDEYREFTGVQHDVWVQWRSGFSALTLPDLTK